MKNTTSQIITGIVFGIITLAIVIGLGYYILIHIDPAEIEKNQLITNEKCCGGIENYCYDTYYSKEDNKCHSTFMIIELINGNIKWDRVLISAIIILIVPIILIIYLRFYLKVDEYGQKIKKALNKRAKKSKN